MNTIDSMCEAPSMMGEHSTKTVANPSHPSSPPSLGSTSSLGSAPPEGGVSKHPGELGDLELGGLLVGKEWHPWGLRPANLKSWKFGCGFLPSTNKASNTPIPYPPIPPTKITIHCPTPPTITSTTTVHTKTATGGKKVLPKKPTKQLPNTYVCEGVDCSFETNSPYKFFNYISTPHMWKPGSQNWCFTKAKALAKGNKPLGIKASGPTTFPAIDIRVKRGLLPSNVVSCGQNSVHCATPIPTYQTSIPTTPPVTLTTETLNLTSSTTTTNSSTTPSPSTTTPTPSTLAITSSEPAPGPTIGTLIPSTPTLHNDITLPTSSISNLLTTTPLHLSPNSAPKKDAVLYFPLSYFLWKRKLPPVPPIPIYPPWSLFPHPKIKKPTSTSHLKWQRRLPNNKVYCWGVNDPKEDYSSQIVTIEHGVGVPKLKENGTWATYSKLLVPKKYHQNISPTHNIHLYNHKLAPKQRLQRPKAGHNTIHKSHGISHHDLLNGIGKTVASETPCKKQPKSHAFKTSKTVVHHSIGNNTTINYTSRLNTSTMNTSTSTTSILPLVPYPSPRTKWTRTLGGALKGGVL